MEMALSDYPDFEVKNGKAEIRLDYDPNKDTNISFQSGIHGVNFNKLLE